MVHLISFSAPLVGCVTVAHGIYNTGCSQPFTCSHVGDLTFDLTNTNTPGIDRHTGQTMVILGLGLPI